MTRRIFVSALIAGAVAGLIGVALQFVFVEPMILEGELYETGARIHFTAQGAESIAGAPPVIFDLARHGLTIASSLVTWVGFALILAAGFGLAERAERDVGARSGALWGLMAFFAVNLAPAAGLPPELPGTVAAELQARQLWWIGTIVSSLVAIMAFAFMEGGLAVALGLFLLLLPHVIGAPVLDRYFGMAPPELAALFVSRTLAVAALTWAILGASLGWLWTRS
jgi:cobalt transporter subunit CbtA